MPDLPALRPILDIHLRLCSIGRGIPTLHSKDR